MLCFIHCHHQSSMIHQASWSDSPKQAEGKDLAISRRFRNCWRNTRELYYAHSQRLLRTTRKPSFEFQSSSTQDPELLPDFDLFRRIDRGIDLTPRSAAVVVNHLTSALYRFPLTVHLRSLDFKRRSQYTITDSYPLDLFLFLSFVAIHNKVKVHKPQVHRNWTTQHVHDQVQR